jgi:uncharacterized membrane protein YuzA (DUF378 family)
MGWMSERVTMSQRRLLLVLLFGGLLFGSLGLMSAMLLAIVLGSSFTTHFLVAWLIIFTLTMVARLALSIQIMIRRRARRRRMRRL